MKDTTAGGVGVHPGATWGGEQQVWDPGAGARLCWQRWILEEGSQERRRITSGAGGGHQILKEMGWHCCRSLEDFDFYSV